jgi:hypothetical protein
MSTRSSDLEIARGVAAVMRQKITPLLERIGALEAQAAALESAQKDFGFVGVWRQGEVYRRGNFVTDAGSLWHCQKMDTRSRPGSNSVEWRLVTKNGGLR